ncbi:uncharacterized protein BX663DRAFT_518892 [Cokeromyces recurvatus]|uniref:uncharacterized protein n=1 Tax=Cokeromyces recurvatus TaxID=90255 RepID=UPI00221F1DFA|nr:uncharacterized protein BX663DRAFT_518892 [Cokeromyces recurvatus]KAI7900191.1 hypothetical protein BX663DRAFT_518892 [Cokeromyces recurvatus]
MRRHNVNRGLSSGEISKSISQRWKELPPDHYFKEESKLKEKHNNANIIYTRPSKPSHHHHHQYVRDPRGRKKNNGLLPKHPIPTLKRESPEARLVEISREIGVRWRSLTDQERQPWIELANQDKERYAREMKTHLGQSLFMNDLNLTTKKGGIYELDELDSEVIATVSQMVNPSSHHI